MAKISVIIPTYNGAAIIGESLRSVIMQTERDIEVLVVDDGSTDNTGEVVEKCGDARVSYIRKANGGSASARNAGLAAATGEFIAFLDHDDLWPPNFLESMVKALEGNPEMGLAYSSLTVRYPDGGEVESYNVRQGMSGWLAGSLFKNAFVWTSASVIRRSVLKDFRYDESLRRSYEDSDFFLRLSAKIPFLFVPDAQAIRRESDANFSAKVGIQPTRILILERFYYKLGGKEHVGVSIARCKLSHACRSVAKAALAQKKRRQAVTLYQKALVYWPLDMRLYGELARALLLKRHLDQEPDWEMPKPLGLPVHSGAILK